MKQNTECCNNTAVCFTHALSKLTHICFFLLNIYLKISILLFRNIADVQSAFSLSEMHVGTFLDNSASPVFYSERVFFCTFNLTHAHSQTPRKHLSCASSEPQKLPDTLTLYIKTCSFLQNQRPLSIHFLISCLKNSISHLSCIFENSAKSLYFIEVGLWNIHFAPNLKSMY